MWGACSDGWVSEDAAIRRENLRRLCHARQWRPRDLERELGGGYSYWRDLLETTSKPFGEKVARRIEEGLGLPRGWLDTPMAAINAQEPQARAYAAPRWPFSDELYRALAAQDEQTLRRFENVLRALLSLPPPPTPLI